LTGKKKERTADSKRKKRAWARLLTKKENIGKEEGTRASRRESPHLSKEKAVKKKRKRKREDITPPTSLRLKKETRKGQGKGS